jgi:putative endonuclease
MSNHASGIKAEEQALIFLSSRGFSLLHKRFKTKAGEIDLIVSKDTIIIFCEVKKRKTLDEAAYAVTPRAQSRIRLSAEIWLAENPDHAHKDLRFDCVFVLPTSIEILENAF